MDLEHYRNFITIVESGSLSAAAEKIHIAQPALTAQIKALQKKYGATSRSWHLWLQSLKC